MPHIKFKLGGCGMCLKPSCLMSLLRLQSSEMWTHVSSREVSAFGSLTYPAYFRVESNMNRRCGLVSVALPSLGLCETAPLRTYFLFLMFYLILCKLSFFYAVNCCCICPHKLLFLPLCLAIRLMSKQYRTLCIVPSQRSGYRLRSHS